MTFDEWLETYHDHLTTSDFVAEECRDLKEYQTVSKWMLRAWEASRFDARRQGTKWYF